MKTKIKLFLSLLFLLGFFATLEAKDTQLITDMLGRKVEIPLNIKSIVTMSAITPLNSLLITMDEGKKIINGIPAMVNRSSANSAKWKWLYIMTPHLKNNVLMQGEDFFPDMERLLKAKPDIVFVLKFDKNIAKAMEDKGLTVVALAWQSVNDIAPTMKLLGKIFHKEKRAEEYMKFFNESVAKAKRLTANIPKEERVKVLFTIFSYLSQPVLIAEWWIKTAGGISMTDNGRKVNRVVYDLEQLYSFDPEVIMVTSNHDKDELLSNSRFKSIKAVASKRVFVSPTVAHVWGNCTVEQPLTVLWALNKFYPKLYSEKELIKDVHYFYKKFFDKDLSQDQVKEIISGKNK